MNVVVPCEYGKDLIENSGDNAWTTFSPYKVYGFFFKRSRADLAEFRTQARSYVCCCSLQVWKRFN